MSEEAEVTQPANDDARLAEIRLLLTERPGRKLPPDTNKMRFLLRLLDEARVDERKKLVAMLREPSDDTREALMTATWESTPAEIEALIKVLADLLERAP